MTTTVESGTIDGTYRLRRPLRAGSLIAVGVVGVGDEPLYGVLSGFAAPVASRSSGGQLPVGCGDRLEYCTWAVYQVLEENETDELALAGEGAAQFLVIEGTGTPTVTTDGVATSHVPLPFPDTCSEDGSVSGACTNAGTIHLGARGCSDGTACAWCGSPGPSMKLAEIYLGRGAFGVSGNPGVGGECADIGIAYSGDSNDHDDNGGGGDADDDDAGTGSDTTAYSNNIVIADNIIKHVTGAPLTVNFANRPIIARNAIKSCGAPVTLSYCLSGNITGNNLVRLPGGLSLTDCKTTLVDGNLISHCAPAFEPGIYLSGGEDLYLHGNRFYTDADAQSNWAISITNAARTGIQGNDFRGSYYWGFVLDYGTATSIGDNLPSSIGAGDYMLKSDYDADDDGIVDEAASVEWDGVQNKPLVFPPEDHTHPWEDITDPPATYPPAMHTHASSDFAALPLHEHCYNENHTAACDGATIIFITANEFAPESTQVILNGMRQTIGLDYTEAATYDAVVMATAPLAIDNLIIDYIAA